MGAPASRTTARGKRSLGDDPLPALLELVRPGASISSLSPTGREGARVRIRVGRRIATTLPRSTIEAIGLRAGAMWTESLARPIAEAAWLDGVRLAAARMLNRRHLSRASLVRALVQRGAPEPLARRAAEDMAALGAIDESALAESLVSRAMAQRPAGPRLLRQKLAVKGVPRAVAERAIEAATAERDAAADALLLAERALARVPASLPAATKARRLLGALARRGFGPDVARAATREAMKRAGW